MDHITRASSRGSEQDVVVARYHWVCPWVQGGQPHPTPPVQVTRGSMQWWNQCCNTSVQWVFHNHCECATVSPIQGAPPPYNVGVMFVVSGCGGQVEAGPDFTTITAPDPVDLTGGCLWSISSPAGTCGLLPRDVSVFTHTHTHTHTHTRAPDCASHRMKRV